MKTSFVISSLSRDDLKSKGFDTSNVTDDQMEKIASKLGDDYCEQLFWTSLEIIAECFGVPRPRVCSNCKNFTKKKIGGRCSKHSMEVSSCGTCEDIDIITEEEYED